MQGVTQDISHRPLCSRDPPPVGLTWILPPFTSMLISTCNQWMQTFAQFCGQAIHITRGPCQGPYGDLHLVLAYPQTKYSPDLLGLLGMLGYSSSTSAPREFH